MEILKWSNSISILELQHLEETNRNIEKDKQFHWHTMRQSSKTLWVGLSSLITILHIRLIIVVIYNRIMRFRSHLEHISHKYFSFLKTSYAPIFFCSFFLFVVLLSDLSSFITSMPFIWLVHIPLSSMFDVYCGPDHVTRRLSCF